LFGAKTRGICSRGKDQEEQQDPWSGPKGLNINRRCVDDGGTGVGGPATSISI